MNRIQVNDCSLAYEFKGSGGESIVFLNGIAMTTAHWMPIVEELESDYRCLVHDFRGQLQSEKPESGYSMENHAADVKALMEELGIPKAHIVGTSYGSEVGMILACRWPEACLSLTVIDGVSETDAVLETAVESWKAAALTNPGLFYKTILPWNYSPEYLSEHMEEFRSRAESITRLPADYFTAFAALCDAFSGLNITEEIRQISCPTLVLTGEKDILKHRGFAEIIVNAIPGSEFRIIPGAGHAVVIEQPGVLGRLILDWLGDL